MGLFFAVKLPSRSPPVATMATSFRLSYIATAFVAATLSTLPVKSFAALLGDKYPFTISMPEAKSLGEDLEDALKIQRKESAEFDAISNIRRAGRFDRDIILKWLRSEGYFSAQLTTNYEKDRIIHQITPGPRYLTEPLRFNFPDSITLPPDHSLPLKAKKPLRAEDVLSTESMLRDYVLENYCLYDVDVRYDAEINHESAQAFVTYTLTPSPSVIFGEIQIDGITSIEADYLKNYLSIPEGECFKRRQVEQSKMALLQTNLLSRVDANIGEPQDGKVSIQFDLLERNHRTLKAGVGYDSNIGPGLTLGWEHRNLKGRGQKLDAQTKISEIERSLLTEITIPHFRSRGQTLSLYTKVTHEVPDAYELTAGEIGMSLSRDLKQYWAGSVGSVLEFSRMIENDQKNDFGLLSFPISLDFINTNDPLDPRYGWALGVTTRPFIDLYDTGRQFIKTTAAASVYLTESDWWAQPTLAIRAATGTIHGEALKAIPASHRYYVGGGGSVRGYAYQHVGELTEGEPDGGLSFGETALELRLRFTNSWGMVIFADGGYAYPGKSPDFGEDFLWGAGLGVRYFTSFAPIRFDIATPLNKRKDANGADIDDSVQIYISIGQAF